MAGLTSRQGARPGLEKVGTVGTAGTGNFPFWRKVFENERTIPMKMKENRKNGAESQGKFLIFFLAPERFQFSVSLTRGGADRGDWTEGWLLHLISHTPTIALFILFFIYSFYFSFYFLFFIFFILFFFWNKNKQINILPGVNELPVLCRQNWVWIGCHCHVC